jgi:hypothetical protein
MVNFAFYNPKAIADKGVTNVYVIMGARGYGKTNSVTIYGIAERVNQYPNETFLIATRKEARAKQILRTIGTYLQDKLKGMYFKKYIKLFRTEQNKQDSISICNNSEASLRGNHIDWLIGDDLVIGSDERSEIEIEKTKAFFREGLKIAKNIVILGQPVHEKDLYAMLKEIAQEQQEGKR